MYNNIYKLVYLSGCLESKKLFIFFLHLLWIDFYHKNLLKVNTLKYVFIQMSENTRNAKIYA